MLQKLRSSINKLIEEKGVDDMLITLADCLKENIQSGVNEKVVPRPGSLAIRWARLGAEVTAVDIDPAMLAADPA